MRQITIEFVNFQSTRKVLYFLLNDIPSQRWIGSKNEKKQWKYTWILSYSFLSPSCKIKQKELQQKLFTWILSFSFLSPSCKIKQKELQQKLFTSLRTSIQVIKKWIWFLLPWEMQVSRALVQKYRSFGSGGIQEN